MPVEIRGLLEDLETYEGKNGFGANVTLSTKIDRKTKRLSFNLKDKKMADELDSLLDTDVILTVELIQNNFGLRFGNIIGIGA